METEVKNILPHLVKVDEKEEGHCDTVRVHQDGKVECLMVDLPSREMTDGEFGPKKLEESDNPVFMDPVLKEGPCEVEVLFSGKSLWKGTAERKRTSGTSGRIRVVGEDKTALPLKAIVRLDSLAPPSLIRDEDTKRLRGE